MCKRENKCDFKENVLLFKGNAVKAIIVVHVFGNMADMEAIMDVAEKYHLKVIEDATEALGTYYTDGRYAGKYAGTIGDFGAYSFNGNKIITTSGGGALICPDKTAADRVKFLSTQARENRPYYYHTTIGYNYRLSNVSAAIGCAQIEELPDRVKRRRCIHGLYSELLAGAEWVTVHDEPSQRFRSNFWLSTVSFDKSVVGRTPDEIRMLLLERGIETRLIWRPMHMQPVFADAPYYGGGCSDGIFENGLCLPSGTTLSDDDIAQVAEALKECLAK